MNEFSRRPQRAYRRRQLWLCQYRSRALCSATGSQDMKAADRLLERFAEQAKSAPAAAKWPIRRWVRIAHLWAGVGLGLWLVMLGLTGSALVYQHSLRRVLERGRRIKPGLPVLPLDELLARVHRQRPDLAVINIEGMAYEGR